ncbi:MAG TPA: hypothetical protein VIU34_27335 [Steroidobacter sp.]
MLEPVQVLKSIFGLVVRLANWLVPSQTQIDREAMHVQLATTCANAASGARINAMERYDNEHQDLELAMRLIESDAGRTKRAAESAQQEFDIASAQPRPRKISIWNFWLRRPALKELQRRAQRIAELGQTQNDCGSNFHRLADKCANGRLALEHDTSTTDRSEQALNGSRRSAPA